MSIALLTAKIQGGYYPRIERICDACINVSKEACKKQRKAWKRMIFCQGIPERCVTVRLNRLEDRIRPSKWLFRRVYKSVKILREEQYHTSSFKLHKRSGIKGSMDHELVMKVSRTSLNVILFKSSSNSGVISTFLQWYLVLKRRYDIIPTCSFQG